ncbi:hypothetical protein SVIOM342S_00178 [Streptomyces violaceorubidus]
MLQFLIRRTFGAALILVLISAFTFFMFFAIPQDPAMLACGKNCTPDALAIIHQNLGLDKPVPVQYWNFLIGIFAGRDFAVGHCSAPCFGVSFANNQNVWDTILDRFPVTISLTLGSLLVFLTLASAPVSWPPSSAAPRSTRRSAPVRWSSARCRSTSSARW